jgi:hypothetical protein
MDFFVEDINVEITGQLDGHGGISDNEEFSYGFLLYTGRDLKSENLQKFWMALKWRKFEK